METTDLQDGFFQSISYDSTLRHLHVRFADGNYYLYSEVTQMDYLGLMSSKQMKSFFEDKIIPRFPSRKMNE
ncbi:KTSC domain-containing protein [Salipaludibacillus daqingensis]|uniref:KTSC domain-containing protein n=1 Tax=Salipaludibacillus daqingensis TaxID=3041001 RepID=UPI0024746CF7|nr:KTSC domain-containing protein [Salipaludibacillus daqingensis]